VGRAEAEADADAEVLADGLALAAVRRVTSDATVVGDPVACGRAAWCRVVTCPTLAAGDPATPTPVSIRPVAEPATALVATSISVVRR
jgi:hypothetical protein